MISTWQPGNKIASGVIEGACRHVVKDRMERAGMRWTIQGAQAMLELRSTYLNRDWDKFIKFRIQKQHERLYPYRSKRGNNAVANGCLTGMSGRPITPIRKHSYWSRLSPLPSHSGRRANHL